jgi:hypothetical protein
VWIWAEKHRAEIERAREAYAKIGGVGTGSPA